MKKRWKRAIRRVKKKLEDLNLGKTIRRLRRNRRHKAARTHARREFKRERDHHLEQVHKAIKNGADPDSPHIKDLKSRIQWLDVRIGELHHVISRLLEKIDELVPKVSRKRKLKYQYVHRIRKLRHKIRQFNQDAQNTDGFGTFDGKAVPKWMIPWLTKSRQNGWNGVLVSGYRTPEYSEQLCYAMCGHPTCPGRCAGRNSNHCCPPTFTGKYPEGAVDVSDYFTFASVQARIGSPLRNNLPLDRVHFSVSGY